MAANPKRFGRAGIDLIEHILRVDVIQAKEARVAGGRRLETLVFAGQMMIGSGNSFTNEEGLRQINFLARSWVATAFGKKLGQEKPPSGEWLSVTQT